LKAGGRRQEAEGRRQKAEGRRQKAGGRRVRFYIQVWVSIGERIKILVSVKIRRVGIAH